MNSVEWTLTVLNRVGEAVTATVTLTATGTVATTGDGDRLAPITVFGPDGLVLGPADGLPWLVELGRELGRSGYSITLIDGPGAPDWR